MTDRHMDHLNSIRTGAFGIRSRCFAEQAFVLTVILGLPSEKSNLYRTRIDPHEIHKCRKADLLTVAETFVYRAGISFSKLEPSAICAGVHRFCDQIDTPTDQWNVLKDAKRNLHRAMLRKSLLMSLSCHSDA